MLTRVGPEKVVEIENKFRAVKTVGEFVAVAAEITAVLYPGESETYIRLRKFHTAYNAALIEALGADFPIKQIPDSFMLIDDHGSVTGTLLGLLGRKYGLPDEVEVIPPMYAPPPYAKGDAN